MAKIYDRADELTERHKHELLPCQICGNTDIRFWPDREMWPFRYNWSINCMTKNCDFVVEHTVKEAIQAWNNLQKRHMRAKEGVFYEAN